jgi:hypothetical protein
MRYATFLSIATLAIALGMSGCGANPTAPLAAATAASTIPGPAQAVSPLPSKATPSSTGSALPVSTVASAPAQTPSTPPTSAGATTNTITMHDNGETFTFQVGERFLLDLGDNLGWQWQFDNPGIVSQVPNSTTTKGSQVWFQAEQPGETTLTARGDPRCRKMQPPCMAPSFAFQVHIIVTSGAFATPAPSTVTYADNGETITLRVGDRFLLKLGDQFEWQVSVVDPTVVSRVVNLLVVKGAQGVCEANKTGETALSATGTVVCLAQQACPVLAVSFKLHIIVR